MNKKQKTLLLVAGIISVILAAALIYYFKQQNAKKEISTAEIMENSTVPVSSETTTPGGLISPEYTGTTKELMMPLANQEPAKVVMLESINIPASKIDFTRLK